MSIPFTELVLPEGRRREISIDRPADVVAMAAALIGKGFRFEVERLRTGEVSMDCSRPADDGPVSMQICANGPGVPDAVDVLVREAHAAVFGVALG